VSRLHQWINTGLLVICAAAIGALWRHETRDLGVQCLDATHPALQHLKIEQPGYCVAVAPAHLDRD
jgi:hypothetical protein